MTFSLYQAIIPSYLQIIGAVEGLIDKAEAHCTSSGAAPETLIEAQLADDMRPFAYQISSVAWHSIGAIEGIRKGVFSPDSVAPPTDFEGLRKKVAQANQALEALTEEEVNGFIGQPVNFEAGEFKIEFTADEFLLSFSQPNFYFHATTAYDILRWKGLQIGKMDFLGQIRRKG